MTAQATQTAQTSDFGAAAFFDVDGTLVWRDFERMKKRTGESVNAATEIKPSEGVAEAFRRMRERSNATFICTGRPMPFVMPSLLALEPTGIVAAAGAFVSVGDTVVRNVYLPRDLVEETAARFAEAHLDATFESDTRSVELHPTGAPVRFAGSLAARDAQELGAYLDGSADVPAVRIQKICTNGVAFEALEPVLPFMREHYTVCDLQGGCFEFSLKGVDKGSGIAAALDFIGHGRAQTFAFGDSENDLSMAGAVETFVAMGNALPSVKAAADYVTLSAADDGVPAGLAHFGLI